VNYQPQEVLDAIPYLGREAGLELENIILKRRLALQDKEQQDNDVPDEE
jgi:hypothetical protein